MWQQTVMMLHFLNLQTQHSHRQTLVAEVFTALCAANELAEENSFQFSQAAVSQHICDFLPSLKTAKVKVKSC